MRTPRWKLLIYAGIILFGLLPVVPNLLPSAQLAALPGWMAGTRITLGLDLRGGSHLVLEVDTRALAAERLETLAEDARVRLREAGIAGAVASADANALVVTIADPARQGEALRALRSLVRTVGLVAFGAGTPDAEITAEGPGKVRLALTDAGIRDRVNAAMGQSLEIIRHRVDEVGVAEPTIQRVGADRILVQLPGVQDPARVKALLGSTAKMSFHSVPPEGAASNGGGGVVTLPGREREARYRIARRATLTGDYLVDAAAGFDQQTGEPIVTFRFDTSGARIFARFTKSHVGEPFAIVMDGKVLSAPVIREPILGGSGQISGGFTVHEATDLAAMLRAGALPAKLTVIEQRSVGPDLGRDAIEMGARTGMIGFVLVFGFMFALYGVWGLIANFALLLNVALTLGALSWLGATLTLPGLAGIVLGIGLAVDANVLINERIREETRKGMSAIAALDAGFRRAFATIVDSNVTTLIATALLFMLGSGPVRGFAVTMGLGIAISMFTAVSVVRLIMEWRVRTRKLKRLEIKSPVRLVPDDTRIPFMRARFLGIGMSILLSLASVVLFIKPGLNYGIDFRGGMQMDVQMSKPADLSLLRHELNALGLGEVALQEFGNSSRVLVRAERQPGGEAAQMQAADRMKSAISAIDTATSFERVEIIGPKVSGELVEAGILAVALAGLAMLAYIWFRFEWPFAVGAIATLILDITKIVGFFAITGLDFNLTAIAAVLTLIGYSVNDKVVVYDRMRETMRLYKRMSLRDLIDRSINETIARSLFTSVTAFLAMLPMAIAGGTAVESFAVPMLFGIVIAASSSIFIAAPILLFLGDWRTRKGARAAMPAAEDTAAVDPLVTN